MAWGSEWEGKAFDMPELLFYSLETFQIAVNKKNWIIIPNTNCSKLFKVSSERNLSRNEFWCFLMFDSKSENVEKERNNYEIMRQTIVNSWKILAPSSSRSVLIHINRPLDFNLRCPRTRNWFSEHHSFARSILITEKTWNLWIHLRTQLSSNIEFVMISVLAM